MSSNLTNDTQLEDVAYSFKNDYDFFTQHAPLNILDKEGKLVRLKANYPQQRLRQEIKTQLTDRGYVRLIVHKPRQTGISTDIAGFFFFRTMMNRGVKTQVMAHDMKTSNDLFAMFDTYYENLDPRLREVYELKVQSKKEKEFSGRYSVYKVSTAGSREGGRGGTRQNLHLSELAFWPDAERLFAGLVQSVKTRGQNTCIIAESTANGIMGVGKYYHDMVMSAEFGQSEYKLLFIPWFEMAEYALKPDPGFQMNEEELDIKERYNLTKEQMFFRRVKINEYPTYDIGLKKFKQEYPSHIKESFETTMDSLIDYDSITKCMRSKDNDHMGLGDAMILGVDPATRGDRAVIAPRRGRKFYEPLIIDTKINPTDPMKFVTDIARAIKEYQAEKVFIDRGVDGNAIISRLKEIGFGSQVVGVDFAEGAMENQIYLNKRAEMWFHLRNMIHEGCKIPDQAEILADLSMMPDYIERTDGRLQLHAKQDIKKINGNRSPDIGDAMALTFAYPVLSNQVRKIKNVRRLT